MTKKIWSALLAISLFGAAPTYAKESGSFTHTSARLTAERLTLEIEALPHMLQKAQVLRDLDGSGQMSQAEFDHAKAEILSYAQKHLGVTLNARALRADSAAVRYRFQEASAAPTRIYVTCSYALLLKPEHLLVRNDMFQELAAAHKNYGTITNGNQSIDFEFPLNTSAPEGAEFALTSGTLELIASGATWYSPAMLWLGAGIGGLALLAVIAYFRKWARRHARRQKRKQRAAPAIAPVARTPRRHAYELENVLS